MHAWETFVESQADELGIETTQKWLKSLKVLRFDACNLYLEANDAFQAMWFEEHIRQKANSLLFNNNKKRIKIHLSVANAPAKSKNRNAKAKSTEEIKHTAFTLTFDELDPNCTLSTFVASEENLLPFKIISMLTTSSTDTHGSFNPIYIHGGDGSGRSHLLMAAAKALRDTGKHVIYSRAQTFTDHVVSAIRAGEMRVFRQAYRNSDVLIIDDVHVFSRKGATQEEFFHTFNTLHVAGKQIILSANCAPSELKLIEPRLISRFEWGIVLPLESPKREDVLKILEMKMLAMNFPLHLKVMEFLVDSFETTKSLNKALEAIILRSHLSRSNTKLSSINLTVPIIRQLLADLLIEEQRNALTPQKIFDGVAEHFGIRAEDIFGKSQTRDCVLPRQIAMHLCRTLLKLPYVKIGEHLGKDHSTVMSSVKLIQKGVDADDSEIAGAHRTILKKLKR